MTVGERIEGTLVVLAPLDVSDAGAVGALAARPRYDPLPLRPPRPAAGAGDRGRAADVGPAGVSDPRMLVVGIEERAGGTVIGNARLQLLPRRRARFSILIGEAEHRGSGQGREATALLCRYAFERLGVEEIMLEVDPRNVPPSRLRAVGFRTPAADDAAQRASR